MSEYIEIRANLPEDLEDLEDRLAVIFESAAILGVQTHPRRDGRIEVSVWVKADGGPAANEARSALKDLGFEAIRVREQVDRDWSDEWRQGLRAFEVGRRWWIDPHPDRASLAPKGRLRLAVEPCSAFGSGTHESTRLVLMELEERDCRSVRVLDIGTGSGVLAVAAERLGAGFVVGVDIDVIAIREAQTTLRRQEWNCQPPLIAGGVDCLGDVQFDLVLCNMIVSNFRPLLGDIHRLLSGSATVVFSGILGSERTEVEEILRGSGLAVSGVRELGEWISVLAVPMGDRS